MQRLPSRQDSVILSPSWFGADFCVKRPHMARKIRRSAGFAKVTSQSLRSRHSTHSPPNLSRKIFVCSFLAGVLFPTEVGVRLCEYFLSLTATPDETSSASSSYWMGIL